MPMPRKASYDDSKRPAIEAAAMKVMAYHGYDGASLQMIANEAGVAPSLIVKFYGGKRGLAVVCIRQFIESVTAEMKKSAARHKSLALHTAHMLGRFQARRSEWRLFVSVMAIPAHEEMCREFLPACHALAQQLTAGFAGEVPPHLAKQYSYLFDACHMAYVLGGTRENCENAKSLLLHTLQPNAAGPCKPPA